MPPPRDPRPPAPAGSREGHLLRRTPRREHSAASLPALTQAQAITEQTFRAAPRASSAPAPASFVCIPASPVHAPAPAALRDQSPLRAACFCLPSSFLFPSFLSRLLETRRLLFPSRPALPSPPRAAPEGAGSPSGQLLGALQTPSPSGGWAPAGGGAGGKRPRPL